MIKNKNVYTNKEWNYCVDRYNCAMCVNKCGYGCIWFGNDWHYEQNDKLPKMKYEYDQK